MSTIDELYDERINQWSDVLLHLEFMRDFVVTNNVKSVIELGVRSGYSTAAFLKGLAETGGTLWSVDLDKRPFEVDADWHFIKGHDLEPAVRDALPATVDLVFIDTSHHFYETLAELRVYGPRGKTVFLHDTELEHPYAQPPNEPPFPVRAAIDAYIAETGRPYHERPGSYGLGIIGVSG